MSNETKQWKVSMAGKQIWENNTSTVCSDIRSKDDARLIVTAVNAYEANLQRIIELQSENQRLTNDKLDVFHAFLAEQKGKDQVLAMLIKAKDCIQNLEKYTSGGEHAIPSFMEEIDTMIKTHLKR